LNQEGYKEEILDHFDYFESLLQDYAWFSGDTFSMMDLSLLPWFERLVVLERYRGIGLSERYENLNCWWKACRQRPKFSSWRGRTPTPL
jgi:glutathione S-transferase